MENGEFAAVRVEIFVGRERGGGFEYECGGVRGGFERGGRVEGGVGDD